MQQLQPAPQEGVDSHKRERQVDIQSLPDPLKRLWYIASCLKAGGDVLLQLGSNGISGFTREELKNLESHCFSRETVSDTDPPLYVQLSRDAAGKAYLKLLRWSVTKNKWQMGFYVSGSPATIQGEMLAPGEAELANYILPMLKKLEAVAGDIVKKITQQKPNHILYRQYFSTQPQEAYWMQLNSPEAAEMHIATTYRVYVQPRISDLKQYYEVVRQVATMAREYDQPLTFKYMYSGRQADAVIMNPDSSKICFYFKDKQEALRFGDYLAGHLPATQDFVGAQIPLQQRFEPQKVWRNGLLVLGKGTREERREVRRKLENIEDLRTQVRGAVLKQAKDLSMTI